MQDQLIEHDVEFRDIKDCPGYRISNTGIVQSCRSTGDGHFRSAWKTLKPTDRKGYLRVSMRRAGKKYCIGVHQLVLFNFVGPCPDGMECRHLNGNAHDNRLENLKWDTHKANYEDQITHGTVALGERNGKSKLTADLVIELRRRVNNGDKMADLAREYGLTFACVQGAIHGKRSWKYIDGCIEKSFSRKLTDEQIIAVRNRFANGERIFEIHRDYPHVSYGAIRSAAKEDSFKHLAPSAWKKKAAELGVPIQ